MVEATQLQHGRGHTFLGSHASSPTVQVAEKSGWECWARGAMGGLSKRLYADPRENPRHRALRNDCSTRQRSPLLHQSPHGAPWPPLENLPRASYRPPSDKQGNTLLVNLPSPMKQL